MSAPDLGSELVAYFQKAAGGRMKVDASTPLLEWGILDSVRILEVAELLKARAGYALRPGDLKREHFKDVRSIVRLAGAAAKAKAPARRRKA